MSNEKSETGKPFVEKAIVRSDGSVEGVTFSLLEIPETCEVIGWCAFRDAYIKQIHIPTGCEVDENAFSGSTGS